MYLSFSLYPFYHFAYINSAYDSAMTGPSCTKTKLLAHQAERRMPEIPQLPPEIIAEILSRLPVKSIMRCKCVCKPWRSFLSDHDFAKMHLKKARRSRRFFLFTEPFQSFDLEAQSYEDIRTTELNIPISINSVDVETVGSCDGLICAAIEDERYFLVWNPTTRVVREIFMPNSSQVGTSFYGFGYDNQLDDYKIMLGSIANGSNEAKVDIFMLKTNKWRRIEGLHCNSVLVGSASFLNGILHWLVVRRDNGAQICEIVSFDLVQEKFREVMQVPDQISHLTRDFKVVGKSLCLYTDMVGDYFEAWVMKEYGNPASWTTSVKFKNDALPGYENYFLLVDITTNGRVVLGYDGFYVVFYHTETETCTTLTIENELEWFLSTPYLQTLISPYCE